MSDFQRLNTLKRRRVPEIASLSRNELIGFLLYCCCNCIGFFWNGWGWKWDFSVVVVFFIATQRSVCVGELGDILGILYMIICWIFLLPVVRFVRWSCRATLGTHLEWAIESIINSLITCGRQLIQDGWMDGWIGKKCSSIRLSYFSPHFFANPLDWLNIYNKGWTEKPCRSVGRTDYGTLIEM